MGRSDYSTGGETRSSQRTHNMDHYSVGEDSRCGSAPQRAEEELSETVGSEHTDSECDEVAFQLYSVFDKQEDHSVSTSKSGVKRTEWQSSWFASKAEVAYQFEFLKTLAPKRRPQQQQSLQNSDHTPRTSNDTRSRRAAGTDVFEPEPILESYDMYDTHGSNAIYRTNRDGNAEHNSSLKRHDQPFGRHRADAHFGAYDGQDEHKTQQHHDYGMYSNQGESQQHSFIQSRQSPHSSVPRHSYNGMYSQRAQEFVFDRHTLENLKPQSLDKVTRCRTTDPGLVMYDVDRQDQHNRKPSHARSPYDMDLDRRGLYPIPAEIDSTLEQQHQQRLIAAQSDSNRRDNGTYPVKHDIDEEFERMKARASEAMKRNSSYNKNDKNNKLLPDRPLYPARSQLENPLDQLRQITEMEPDHVTDLEHDLQYADKTDIDFEFEQMRRQAANANKNTKSHAAQATAEYTWRNPRSAQPLPGGTDFRPPAPLHSSNNDDSHGVPGRSNFLQYREHYKSSQDEDGKDDLDREFNRLRSRTANLVRLDAATIASITSSMRRPPTGNSPLSPSAAAVLEGLPQQTAFPGSNLRMSSPRTEADRHLQDTKAEIANQFDQLRSRAADSSRDNLASMPSPPSYLARPFQFFNIFDGARDIEGGANPVKAEIENEFDQMRSRARSAQNGDAAAAAHPSKNEIDSQFAQLRTRSRSAQVMSRSADIIRFRRPTRPGAVFVPWGGRGPPPATLNSMARRSSHEETTEPFREEACDQLEADPEEVAPEGSPATPETQEEAEPAELPPTPPSSNDDYPEAAPEMVWTPKPRSYKSWAIPLLVLIVLSAVGTGIGVHVFRKRHARSNFSYGSLPITAMELPAIACSVGMQNAQPNVVTQCACKGNITVVASDIAATYESLRNNGFIAALIPGFNASLESCDPANQALVWLSSATGMPLDEMHRTQRFALALLYIHWKGQEWISSKGWLSSNDECSWAGVSCDSNRQVSMIDLSNNNLRGELSSGIGLLTNLNSLSLASNSLQGTLPTEMAKLSLLLSLTLASNSLTGSIPPELSKISRITSVDLDFNSLVGTLPTELGLLTDLLSFSVSTNELKGSLPTEFGLLRNLRGISIQANSMTGTLPTEIGMWLSAQTINLSQNKFYGSTIPTEIGLITSLTIFQIASSGVKGSLPDELFNIRSLQDFDGQDNLLIGTFPTLIGQLIDITFLRLSNNQMTGSIPTEIGLCTRLDELMIGGNDFSSTLPDQLGQTALQIFEIMGNKLTGSVPVPVCNLVRPLYCSNQGSSLQCSCCQCL